MRKDIKGNVGEQEINNRLDDEVLGDAAREHRLPLHEIERDGVVETNKPTIGQ